MNLHVADLMTRLTDYLRRRTAPKNIGSDERLQAEQIKEYANILRKFAPEGDSLNDWWRKFCENLSLESETWAWPSPKDVVKAAKSASAETGAAKGEQWSPDSVAVNLKRLNEGLPIGDSWLWGSGAIKLEQAGASRQRLRERRLQMAEQMNEIYPPEQVRARLLELKALHEAARADAEARKFPQQREINIPKKPIFTAEELEGLVE